MTEPKVISVTLLKCQFSLHGPFRLAHVCCEILCDSVYVLLYQENRV